LGLILSDNPWAGQNKRACGQARFAARLACVKIEAPWETMLVKQFCWSWVYEPPDKHHPKLTFRYFLDIKQHYILNIQL
jgi:hypothetical protein